MSGRDCLPTWKRRHGVGLKRLIVVGSSAALIASGLSGGALAAEIPLRVELWEGRFGGPAQGWDDPVDLVVSPTGSAVFVTGTSTANETGRDIATVGYEVESGRELWAARYDGPQPHVPQQFGSGWDESAAIGVSPDGALVFVTGSSSGTETDRDYATIAYDADSGDQVWLARYDGPAGGRDSPTGLAVSPDGSAVFVTGESFGGRSISDYATVAYDSETGDQLWVARYDGLGWLSPWNGWDTPVDIAADPSGTRVFVTGYSFNPLTSRNDFVTVAYAAHDGAELWKARYGGIGSRWDEPFALGVSPDGASVFVTGSSGDDEARDYSTVAYDATSGQELWDSRYAGPVGTWNAAWALAVNPNGSAVYVTGGSVGPGTWRDYATVAYDAGTGAELWEARYDGPASRDDLANAVSVSPDGSKVLVTGASQGTSTRTDYASVAYDAASGDALWLARRISGRGLAITTTPDGSNALVTGRVSVPGGRPPPIGPSTEWATLAYSLADIVIKDTVLELTVVGQGSSMALRARLAERDTPAVGIAGKTISFYSDGELLGAEVTDGDGFASVAVPPGHRGANRIYEAAFEGNDTYGSSSATRPGRGGQAGGESGPARTGWSHKGAVTAR
jgi:DNA-binding beta-propeller fold protein YncE